MADSPEECPSDNVLPETLPERARRMADRIEKVIDDVVTSFESPDPLERLRRLQRVSNEILFDMSPVVDWLERHQPLAAEPLKRRLCLITDSAEKCVGRAIPEYDGGKLREAAPGARASEEANSAVTNHVAARMTAISIRGIADDMEAEQQRQEAFAPEHWQPLVDSLGAKISAGVTTKMPAKASRTRPGRPKADYETCQHEADLADKWKHAHEAGVYKLDFARDNKMSVKELDQLLDRVYQRNKSSEK